MTTATATMIERLDAAMEAVWAADAAWYADLESAEAKSGYKAAKAAYKTLADEAEAHGTLGECGRCGGVGGWQGWPGFTCFDCGGSGKMPYKRVRFQASPPTRAKREAEHRAKMAVERVEGEARWAAFAAAHPAIAEFLAPHVLPEPDEHGNYDESVPVDHFLCSIREKVVKYGELTEKQIAAVVGSMGRAKIEADRKAKLATAGAYPGGTQTVEGEIVSVKPGKGYMGGSVYKALILLDTGHKAYGTASEKFYAAAEGLGVTVEGLKVRFTAEFERSQDDPHFGFFKKPRAVEALGHAGGEA